MRQRRRQRGFMLLIAVTCIPLFGLLVLVVSAQTAQLSKQTRLVERQLEQKNLLLSAEAWLRVHDSSIKTLQAGQTITLPVADTARRPATCTGQIVSQEGESVLLLLTLTDDSRTHPPVERQYRLFY